ncbi:PA4642 family protein [Endozoicomonas arenosclerae]|uniref:PA4642 family protein n=1 Tax=Endozoicomonas arenosclerae TaxID=1633495 RepID=UPI00078284C4|nr:PA4642 family protein [Endozoicomonas arenosclerae]
MKKDKQKVIGEVLSDERIKELLTLQAPAGEDKALHILTRAYRALRADDFERFLRFYSETGLEINPVTSEGGSFLSTLEKHQHASPYVQALKNCGAS